MTAKQILFESSVVPELWAETTARQRAVLVSKLAACPNGIMRAWQRTPKGWITAEITLPNDEFYKFRVDHRANILDARIERAPDGESKYQKRYANNPDAQRHMVQNLWTKRQKRISAP